MKRRAAVHRTIIVVDVEGFGDHTRIRPNQLIVRDTMYRAVQQGLRAAGVRWIRCHHADRGDGVFILAPLRTDKVRLAEALPTALAKSLRRHNSRHPPEERIRLRLAMHAGEVARDEHGATGNSINLAFRLLDAPELKSAFRRAPGVLAVITSEWFYDEVVRHSSVAGAYRRIPVTVKETSTSGWMHTVNVSNTPQPAAAVIRRMLTWAQFIRRS
ncbi:hypothetical protein ALI144C_25890 [Actinosynnema sp. ALI-1.44]|uniref:hypothetical protein n=1 Tax=Actinosynnema sp. ALI-1.44 TaxID=1933779 RepID=UPI0009D34DE4|nr:hypothetical protein [Actinosynnema sp. ALI-1.44]ONI79265.1 hypothetical protein ALI144C_25890 [Actinosynnema sp. ALI-1.44]